MNLNLPIRKNRTKAAMCTLFATAGLFLISNQAQAQRVRLYKQSVSSHEAANERYIFERGDEVFARGDLLSSNPAWRFEVSDPVVRSLQQTSTCASTTTVLNDVFDSDLTDGLSYGVATCPASSTADPLTTAAFQGGMWQYRIKGFGSLSDCNDPAVVSTKFMDAYFRLAEAYAFSDAAARTTAAGDACEASGICASALPDRVDFCPGETAYLRIRGFWPCRTNAAYQIIKQDGSTSSIVTLPATGTSGNVNIDYIIPALGSAAEEGLWQIRIGLLDGTGTAFDSRYTTELNAFDVEINNTITAHKFHDANFSGTQDVGEQNIAGWKMTLSGDASEVAYTDANGDVTFSGLPNGEYTVTEGSLPNFIPTMATSQAVTFNGQGCSNATVSFGNVCIGGATMAKSKGWWGNKNGLQQITKQYFCELNDLCLRNIDGTPYNPIMGCPTPSNAQLNAAKTSFDTWLQQANASNMASMLSAQLAAMKLNVLKGNVSLANVIYAPGTNSADIFGFASIFAIMNEANTLLCTGGSDPLIILGGDPLRARAGALKDALDYGNNNQNYLLNESCAVNFPTNGTARLASKESGSLDGVTLATYPNPLTDRTTISYTLPEAGNVSLIVYDGFGRQVAMLQDGLKHAGAYEANWNAGDLAAGIYFCRMAIITEAGAQHLQTTKMILLK